MQRTSTLITIVGIFFVAGVLLLFSFSLKAGGPTVRGGYTLLTEVDDSKGLEKGAEVLRAGVPVGVVEEISLGEGEKNVVVVRMRIRRDAVVRKDAVASIQLKSLLGTYFVHLSHGSPTSPAAQANDRLQSEEVVDINAVMRVLATLGDKTEGLIGSFNENQATFFEKVNGMIDENRDNLKTITDALAEAAPKIETFFDDVSEVTQSLQDGTGTLGKLLKDDEVYEHFRVATANFEDISSKMREGEGTLGKLIYDDQLATKLDETFQNVNEASRALKEVLDENSKDLNELLKSLKGVGPNIKETVDNFLEVSRKVNSGEGTIGKLVNDPELYDEARRTILQIRKTFEEGEEQSVLRTFLGVFFGSLI